jgi:integrase
MQTSAKSKSSRRTVPLNKAAYSALDALKKQTNCEYVISTKDGNAVHPAPFQKTLDRICKTADIERFGVHALRHTFASKMIEGGVDIKIVSKILGHSSVRITYDIYIHVLDKHKKEAVESIDFT